MKRLITMIVCLTFVFSTFAFAAVGSGKIAASSCRFDQSSIYRRFNQGKGIFRTTLPILEARTGKKLDYQDDKARKTMKVDKADKAE